MTPLRFLPIFLPKLRIFKPNFTGLKAYLRLSAKLHIKFIKRTKVMPLLVSPTPCFLKLQKHITLYKKTLLYQISKNRY